MSDLRQFRQYLTEKAAVLAANTLLNVHLDYCNSLLTSLFNFNMHKLQSIQNTLCRFVTNCNRYSLGTPILKPLHWLPVEFWCIFKTVTLVYKFLHSGHPSDFSPHLSILSGRYGRTYNHPDKRFTQVPHYYPSVHKSNKILQSQFSF